MKDNMQVVEPNQIIEAKLKKMSKGFLDTLYVGMTLVADTFEEDDPERLEYSFYARDLSEKYGLENEKSIYKKLKDQVTSTMEKDSLMYIHENGEDIRYFVFQEVRYADKEGRVTIMFTTRFKKILHQMLIARGKKAYFGLRDVMGMKSEYTKKMYPVLLEYVGKPMIFNGRGSLQGKKFDRIDTIENFKELLCIPKSYVIKNIKDTCTVIVAEIEAYTPYHAEVFYNQIAGRGRYGGKITHICWTITKKTNKEPKPANPQILVDAPEPPKPEPTEQEKWLMALSGLDLTSCKMILKSAVKHNRKPGYIEKCVRYVNENGAENKGASINYFMSHDLAEKKSVAKKNSFCNFKQREGIDLDALADELSELR